MTPKISATDDLCLAATVIACHTKFKCNWKMPICSKWIKNWLEKQSTYSHVNLFNECLQPDDWRKYLRMDEYIYWTFELDDTFYKKQDSIMRKAITPHERLSTTLRFLATGRCIQDFKYSVAIHLQS